MTATASAPSPPGPGAEPQPPRSPMAKLAFVVISVAVVGIAAMWVYAFVFASRQGVYRIEDDAWRANAQQVCAAAQDQRLELADLSEGVITDPTAAQLAQRAGIIDQATDILEQMVDDVVAFPLTDDRDQQLETVWECHYRTLLQDRREHAEQLRSGSNDPFVETVVGGGPVTNVITDFTSGNDIKACGPPADMSSGGM
jgi:hypothetical protein